MTAVGAVAAVVLYWRTATDETVEPKELENPFRLRPALLFGAIFAGVLLVSEYANEWFGASGVYATAFFSGLADVDAMTITLSRLAADGTVSQEVATTGIVIAAIANTLLKAALVWVLGTEELSRLVSIVLGAVVLSGLAFLVV
jgi:uncharacterized membrane protein (DUF4010 family)